MVQTKDLERIRYAGLYLRESGYEVIQTARRSFLTSPHAPRAPLPPCPIAGLPQVFDFKPHQGFLSDRWIHPDLAAAGLSTSSCCYMYGFVREDLLRELAPDVGGGRADFAGRKGAASSENRLVRSRSRRRDRP